MPSLVESEPNALPGGEKVYMLQLPAVCWVIWRARNGICFEKKEFNNPIVRRIFLWNRGSLPPADKI
jgi:hypothetical protein